MGRDVTTGNIDDIMNNRDEGMTLCHGANRGSRGQVVTIRRRGQNDRDKGILTRPRPAATGAYGP